MQIPVRWVFNGRRDQGLHRVRVHREQQHVEERVEVGAKQQTIGDMVRRGAEVRRDVRGL